MQPASRTGLPGAQPRRTGGPESLGLWSKPASIAARARVLQRVRARFRPRSRRLGFQLVQAPAARNRGWKCARAKVSVKDFMCLAVFKKNGPLAPPNEDVWSERKGKAGKLANTELGGLYILHCKGQKMLKGKTVQSLGMADTADELQYSPLGWLLSSFDCRKRSSKEI